MDARAYPELLADLADQVALKIVELGTPMDKAADIGFAVAEHIREHWGGQPIYLPKGAQYDFSMRDMQVFERFNGHNHAALAREYNLTVMRIYQIVKAVRAELIKKRQGALF
jgi:Mor family transcriptional regulator